MTLSGTSEAAGSLQRAFLLLRLLGQAGSAGLRLTELATASGLPRPSVLRLLRALAAEGAVEHEAATRRYRLGLALLVMAARAGNPSELRALGRPALLRLTAALGETVFLLVRNGFDAVCIERSAGPLPIRSFTGDIGGKVPLGLGQGATAILAFSPPGEQEVILRHNLPRLRALGCPGEAELRAELDQVRVDGYCGSFTGLIPGMAGLAVPVLDHDGFAPAALSIGSTTDRLDPQRRAAAVALLREEAGAIGARLNPFEPALRRAGAAVEASGGG